MRRRRRSNTVRRKRDLLWVSNSVAISGGWFQTTLLQPSDWQVAATRSFERATLLRIVGWLSFKQVTTVAGANAALYAMILKMATAEANVDPTIITNYDDKDILWTHGAMFHGSDANTNLDSASMIELAVNTHRVDVRVKRKVDSSEKIQLEMASVSGTSAPGWECTGILRCLVDRT